MAEGTDDLSKLFDDDLSAHDGLGALESRSHLSNGTDEEMGSVGLPTVKKAKEKSSKPASKKQRKKLEADLDRLLLETDFVLPIPEPPRHRLRELFAALDLEQAEGQRMLASKVQLVSVLQKRGISAELLKRVPKLSVDNYASQLNEKSLLHARGKSSIERLNELLAEKQQEQFKIMQEKRRIKEERMLQDAEPLVLNCRIVDSDDEPSSLLNGEIVTEEQWADGAEECTVKTEECTVKTEECTVKTAECTIQSMEECTIQSTEPLHPPVKTSSSIDTDMDSDIPDSGELNFSNLPESQTLSGDEEDILNDGRLLNLLSQKFSTPSDRIVQTPKRISEFFDQEAQVEDELGNIVTELDPEIAANEAELALEMAQSKFIQEGNVPVNKDEIEQAHREHQQQQDARDLDEIYRRVNHTKRSMEFDSMLQRYGESLVDDDSEDALEFNEALLDDRAVELELDEIAHLAPTPTQKSAVGGDHENFKMSFECDFAAATKEHREVREKRPIFVPRNNLEGIASLASEPKRLKPFQVTNGHIPKHLPK